MTIRPVDVSEITRAVEARLIADATLHAKSLNVERSSALNDDSSRCPWAGVYRIDVEYPLRTLGLGAGFRGQRVNLVVFAQEADGRSGADCEDRLEGLIADVMGVLLSDPTLGGVVETLDDWQITYLDYSHDEAGYMQTAGIYFTAITNVNAQ